MLDGAAKCIRNKWDAKLILMMPNSGLVRACTLHGCDHSWDECVKKESLGGRLCCSVQPPLSQTGSHRETSCKFVTCAPAHFSLPSTAPPTFLCAIKSNLFGWLIKLRMLSKRMKRLEKFHLKSFFSASELSKSIHEYFCSLKKDSIMSFSTKYQILYLFLRQELWK